MEDLRQMTSKMNRWFVFYFLCGPFVFLSFCLIMFGFTATFSFFKVFLIVAPFIIFFTMLLFYLMNKKLADLIDRALEGKVTDDDVAFMGSFSRNGAILIQVGDMAGFAVIIVTSYLKGTVVSPAQGFFLGLLALIVSTAMPTFFFYSSKVLLYFLGNKVNYIPLNLFHKLAIPILTAVMILLSYASAGIYRMNYNQVHAMTTSLIETGVEKNRNFIDAFFSQTLTELDAHSYNDIIRSVNPERMAPFLRLLHEKRNQDKLEMYWVADPLGNTITSVGGKTNIGDRPYFKYVMEKGAYTFSEPVVNKTTGNTMVVCAVPVKRDGRTAGVLCASILVDTLDKLFTRDTITATGRYFLIDEYGKFIYHRNHDMVGKSIGKDLVDDGVRNIGTNKLMTEKENVQFPYSIDGRHSLAYKTKVPVLGYYLIFSLDQSDYLKKINTIVYQIIAALISLSLIVFVIILRISQSFSTPIRNMIGVIHRLADGDLTAESTDFLADEFGELIRNFKLFQKRMREIIQRALDAAVQLSSSAEELAATSSTLSEGAQSQAASVEEASASIEEVSGSIELINNNAGEQADLAKATYASMEELKKDNETVAGYANQALSAARSTTDQANTGRGLMESTIEGMNNIDDSTKKIADMVSLISDISDQVNLLALNASIEAARAGEHGKGFAVVAEEISKLADETASSAKNITQFVKTGLQEVNRGRQYVDATSGALNNIIDYITQTEELVRKITESAESQAQSSQVVLGDTRKVMEMAESISSSTNEQMLTNQEMSKTVEQINQNTQSSAAAAEQIASSAEEISAQAESLRQQMQFFRV